MVWASMRSLFTTTVGSYPLPDWLVAQPTGQALVDATRVVFDIQRQAGIDLPTDGELYRFDINHPDTNGMIEYFTRRLGGISSEVGREAATAYRQKEEMGYRAQPAGVVVAPITEGALNLPEDGARAAGVAGGAFKLTLTSPYMLARTLLDRHYHDFEALTMDIARALAAQVAHLPCACVQVDEANVPGNPAAAPLAARAINTVLAAAPAGMTKAVHLCFGNYGGQTIQRGTWAALLNFFDTVQADHFVLELAQRPEEDLAALQEIPRRVGLGVGVIDIKSNAVESPETVARRIEKAGRLLGPERITCVHPDCGFWMLKRSVVDRKIEALVKGRDLFAAAGGH